MTQARRAGKTRPNSPAGAATRSTGSTVAVPAETRAKRPPNTKQEPRFRPAAEWEALGVPVQRSKGEFPSCERETSVSFVDSDRTAEVNTCKRDWQRQLERDGAKPQSIHLFTDSDAQFRWYVIPKSWVHKPGRASAP